MPKNITIEIKNGAPLRTQPTISLENVGPQGFCELVNWRRHEDQLWRREGWRKFGPSPDFAAAQQYEYDADEDITRLCELVRPNGERVIIGCSATKIKRFNLIMGAWETIGNGFSAEGKRWQVVPSMNGYCTFNNGVDLPVAYRVEWRTVQPLFELREVGVARVGRICEYNGFLFVADITEIKADQLDVFMNGGNPYGIPPEAIVNRLPWAVAWSEYGEPRRWAPLFDVRMPAASATITLPFPSTVFAPVEENAGVTSGYDGIAADGSYIYAIANESGLAGATLTRIDPVTKATTNLAVLTTAGSLANPFRGLVYDGTHLWAIPYNHTALVRYHIGTGVQTQYIHGQGTGAFAGGVLDGTTLWLVPFNSPNIIRVNLTTSALTLIAHSQTTPAFRGGASDGTFLWLAPWDSANFVRVNLSTDALSLAANSHGTQAFGDVVYDGASMWFAPYDSNNILKIDAESFVATAYPHGLGNGVSLGAVFDGANVWFNSYTNSSFIRVNTRTGDRTLFPHTYGANAFNWAIYDGQGIWLSPETATSQVVRVLPPIIDVTAETRVGVINGGIDGGVLGGQTDYEDGVRVTNVSGPDLTMELTTDVDLTYPRNVTISRWTDLNTLVGRSLLQGDGSEIIGMEKLGLLLVIYRPTGAYTGRYTGIAAEPFQFRPRYDGNAVPLFGDCITLLEGKFHLYPSVNGRFMAFDGMTEPTEHLDCTHAKDVFFGGLVKTDPCWASQLPFHEESLFMNMLTTMALCSEADNRGVSEIDARIDAACFCRKPGENVNWFVIGIGRFIYTYGYEDGAGTTWHRDGVPTPAYLRSGLLHFGDLHNEKTLQAWTPLYASSSPDVELSVNLRGCWNPGAPLTTLLANEILPSPTGENFIPCLYQRIFLQDEIRVTDSRDLNVMLSGRLFTIERVGALGVTRTDR